jgi:hypothetical protein
MAVHRSRCRSSSRYPGALESARSLPEEAIPRSPTLPANLSQRTIDAEYKRPRPRTSCTPQGLIEALEAMQEIPTAQRLGALLALDDRAALASRVGGWLRNKPLRLVPLERRQAPHTSSEINAAFKVRLPAGESSANT